MVVNITFNSVHVIVLGANSGMLDALEQVTLGLAHVVFI
jgi:hypothetical protein